MPGKKRTRDKENSKKRHRGEERETQHRSGEKGERREEEEDQRKSGRTERRDDWTAARRGRGERVNRVGGVCGVRQSISGLRKAVHKLADKRRGGKNTMVEIRSGGGLKCSCVNLFGWLTEHIRHEKVKGER
jgi:hypothetical protein